MSVTGIITAIIIGAILGVIGRAIAPGKQDIPLWLTVGVGIIAALIGTAIVGGLRDTNGFDWIEVLAQVVLAVVGVILASRLYPGSASRH